MTSTYARANYTHPQANFNAPLAQHHVRHLCAHITVLVGVAVGGWAEAPLKCGHLSFSLKIIDFHSIYTIHSSYLKGGTNSCPITRIAVDSEVLSYGDILITSTYLQWEPRRYPTENLEASGTAGKLRLSKLYCSERREPSGRFSMGIAEAIQHQAFAVRQ